MEFNLITEVIKNTSKSEGVLKTYLLNEEVLLNNDNTEQIEVCINIKDPSGEMGVVLNKEQALKFANQIIKLATLIED